MKKMIAGLGLLLCLSLGSRAQKTYVLKGEISQPRSSYLYLSYWDKAGQRQVDSSKIENNKFVFKGKLQEPILAILYSDPNIERAANPDLLRFYLEPASMTANLTTGKFADAEIKGSKTQDEWSLLNQKEKVVRNEMVDLDREYAEKSKKLRDADRALKEMEAKVAKLTEEQSDFKQNFEPFKKRLNQINLDFIVNNPDSYVSSHLMLYMMSRIDLNEVERLYAGLSDRVKKSADGMEVSNHIREVKSGSPGSKAHEFRATDIDGKSLALADYRGKYVLLDFWASWCVPCRKSNPHLISIYNKYKDKGFEIIGVADDDNNEKAWRKAVDQDKIMIWRHVLNGMKVNDGQYDRSRAIANNYGVSSLPTKVLVDPNGMIVGRYSSGSEKDDDLDNKLVEIFGQ
ncbi:MAG: AhpC/TSA family protein [Sphingobacterium sp.]|uniref:TlpA disulfide reductase family protein n=1 Tax=Sphingobacterium sp. TaxID=341027 RepID=UPI00283BA0EF|nr:TlpA disulfide reductase family protein [Sphingobacterium sp.]MDR3007327.1 AhpC/TSA family protein [Sphingobacterium sp.]